MADGAYKYEFEIAEQFFKDLDQDIVSTGKFSVKIDLEKRSEVIVIDIEHRGHIDTACDRCSEQIELPVNDVGQIVIKFVEEMKMDDEVTYLMKGTEKLDLAPFIFEVISLSLPLVKRYDCERDKKAPCNMKVLEILQGNQRVQDEQISPIWDELKKLNLES